MNPPHDAAGVEREAPSDAAAASSSALTIPLPQHTRLIAVELADRTDQHNELVHERAWLLHPSQRLTLRGNLFVAEQTIGEQRGWVLLKAAPLPHARARQSEADLSVAKRDGGFVATLHDEDAYPWHVLEYTGGALGRSQVLQRLQRQARPNLPVWFITNTWGDRSRDARINEAFILQEIAAAKRLGADLMQIDDGWQRGRTANAAAAQTQGGGVWAGFYDADPDFWTPHPDRLPRGLEPIVAAAADAGLKLGLWFAPDSSDEFANWQRDVQTMLDLRRRYDVAAFKLDSIQMTSDAAEQNVHRMLDELMKQTAGQLVLDLDVTAGTRPGYFGAMHAGPVFVENRYTDWHNHWPHQTLGNLWSLARWVDPRRLRMEMLNVARNAPLYADDPLAPAVYDPAYLFATIMFAQPLGWFEASNLPEAYFEQLPQITSVWRAHREAIFDGTILPLGDRPDGASWTGFVSIASDRQSAYLLVLRETNDRPTHTFALPDPLHAQAADVLYHSAAAEVTCTAQGVVARLAAPRSAVLVKVDCRA